MKLIFDTFSGRPNPALTASGLLEKALAELLGDLRMLGISTPMPGRLGYRGLRLELPVSEAFRHGVAPVSTIPALTASAHLDLLRAIASIIEGIGEFFGDALSEIARIIRAIIRAILGAASGPATPGSRSPTACAYERLAFDPAPWNDPAYIATNNCYAYAANKRASYPSKPQPGTASGRSAPLDLSNGDDVAAWSKRDGAHIVTDCLPATDIPRGLVALVIWPGVDYHWYRHQSNCWGHKPGGTPATNLDHSGRLITDPSSCDRWGYTIFHGYLLMGDKQNVAA